MYIVEVWLVVIVLVFIFVLLKNKIVSFGEDVKIMCKLGGVLSFIVEWYKDNFFIIK